MRAKSNITLQSYEDIFGEAANPAESTGGVASVPLTALHAFPEHPYSVPDNEELAQLTESIRENGILSPLMVMPHPEISGEYVIISGHRRAEAAKRAELTEVPCVIREITLQQATVEMVDTNLYRQNIPMSERAKAYQMRMDAIKAMRADGTLQLETGKRSDQELAEQIGESRANVQRILRLNNLIPELAQLVDKEEIAMTAGVAVSYLDAEAQQRVAGLLTRKGGGALLTQERAEKIKALAQEGDLTEANLAAVINGRSIYTRKDIAKEISQYCEDICTGHAADLLLRYGRQMSVTDAAAYLRETCPERSDGRYRDLEIVYKREGIEMVTRRYYDDTKQYRATEIPYEQLAEEMEKTWKRLCRKDKLLQPEAMTKLQRKTLQALLAQQPYTTDARKYLLSAKKIRFDSSLSRQPVEVKLEPEGVRFSCKWWGEGCEVKEVGCRLEELCEILEQDQAQLADQGRKLAEKEEQKQAEILERKRAELQKKRAQLDTELRDMTLRHPSYTLEDVRNEAAALASVKGDMLIYRDAMNCYLQQMETREAAPLRRWVPEMKAAERKKWLADYRAWGLWHFDPVLPARYYRFDFADGSAIVIRDIPRWHNWEGCFKADLTYYSLPADGLYTTLDECQSYVDACDKQVAEALRYQKQHPELKEMLTQPETVNELSDEDLAEAVAEEAMEMEMGM